MAGFATDSGFVVDDDPNNLTDEAVAKIALTIAQTGAVPHFAYRQWRAEPWWWRLLHPPTAIRITPDSPPLGWEYPQRKEAEDATG